MILKFISKDKGSQSVEKETKEEQFRVTEKISQEKTDIQEEHEVSSPAQIKITGAKFVKEDIEKGRLYFQDKCEECGAAGKEISKIEKGKAEVTTKSQISSPQEGKKHGKSRSKR